MTAANETTVRRLEAADLPAALRLTQAQQWSHRLDDWELHFRLGRGWAVVGAAGELLGTASWWAYGPAFGTVGLVVVHPDAQGRGIGRRLMDAVIADAGSRALQLNSTAVGLELYRRCGFVERGGIAQRHGVPQPRDVPAPSDLRLRDVSAADLPRLCELDRLAAGAPRDALVTEVLRISTGGTVAERGGALVGFALQRSSGRGTTVGPVVAPDEDVAVALVGARLAANVGFTRLDVPTSATSLAAFLDGAGLPAVDHVTPMVRGAAPAASRGWQAYGLVSQALN